MEQKEIRCPSCECQEGTLHESGWCEYEVCPFCQGSLFDCGCGYPDIELGPEYPPESEEAYEEWERLRLIELEKKGRIPFVLQPQICPLCGEMWPRPFHVPKKKWKKFVPPNLQDKLICRSCYETKLKRFFPDGWKMAQKPKPIVTEKNTGESPTPSDKSYLEIEREGIDNIKRELEREDRFTKQRKKEVKALSATALLVDTVQRIKEVKHLARELYGHHTFSGNVPRQWPFQPSIDLDKIHRRATTEANIYDPFRWLCKEIATTGCLVKAALSKVRKA